VLWASGGTGERVLGRWVGWGEDREGSEDERWTR